MRLTLAVSILFLLPAVAHAQDARKHLTEGNKKYSARDYDGAIREYTRAIEINPKYTDALFNRCLALKQKGRWKEAKADINRTIQLKSDWARAYDLRGQLTSYSEDSAITDFTKAIRLDPADAWFIYRRGDCHINRREYEKGFRDLTWALELKPGEKKFKDRLAEAYDSRADRRRDNNDYAGAVRDYDLSLELRPGYLVFIGRGVAYWHLKDYPSAIRDFSKTIELKPKDAIGWYYRGWARIAHKDYDGAIDDLNNAIKVEKNLQSRVLQTLTRGEAREKKGDVEGAIEDYDRVGEMSPTDWRGVIAKGDMQVRLGKLDDAIATFTGIVDLKDDNRNEWAKARALLGRAEALATQSRKNGKRVIEDLDKVGRYDSRPWFMTRSGETRLKIRDFDNAVRDFTRAIERDAKWVAAYIGRARAYSEKGSGLSRRKSRKDFEKALQLDPKSAEAYYYRARSNSGNRKTAEALVDCSRAIELNPEFADAYLFRARLWNELKQGNSAFDDFRRVLKLQPENTSARMGLLNLYENANNFKDAVRMADEIIKVDPSIRRYVKRAELRLKAGDARGAVEDCTRAIAMKADKNSWSENYEQERAHVVRAEARILLKQYDDAISDAGTAIKSDRSKGFLWRGIANRARGKLAEAESDLQEAVKKGYGEKGYRELASLQYERGDFDGSDASYKIAARYAKGDAGFHGSYGYILYDKGDLERALYQFMRARELDPSRGQYLLYRIWMIRSRFGNRAAATRELRARWESRSATSRKSWPARIEECLIGGRTEEALLDNAQGREQECEANFYAGMLRQIAKDRDKARERYQACLATGVTTFTEYRSAAVELSRMLAGMRVAPGPKRGIVVAEVVPNGPAEKVGLTNGITITTLNGKPISMAGWGSALQGAKPGEDWTLTVIRDGKLDSAKVKLSK